MLFAAVVLILLRLPLNAFVQAAAKHNIMALCFKAGISVAVIFGTMQFNSVSISTTPFHEVGFVRQAV